MLKKPSITKEQAISEVNRIYNLTNKIPTRMEFLKANTLTGLYKTSINMLFGSYSEMIKQSGLKPLKDFSFTSFIKKCENEKCTNEFTVIETHKKKRFCCRSCSNTSVVRRQKKIQISTYGSKQKRIVVEKIPLCVNCGKEHNRLSDLCSDQCKIEHRMKNTILKNSFCTGPMANKYRIIRDTARTYSKYVLKNHCIKCRV